MFVFGGMWAGCTKSLVGKPTATLDLCVLADSSSHTHHTTSMGVCELYTAGKGHSLVVSKPQKLKLQTWALQIIPPPPTYVWICVTKSKVCQDTHSVSLPEGPALLDFWCSCRWSPLAPPTVSTFDPGPSPSLLPSLTSVSSLISLV